MRRVFLTAGLSALSALCCCVSGFSPLVQASSPAQSPLHSRDQRGVQRQMNQRKVRSATAARGGFCPPLGGPLFSTFPPQEGAAGAGGERDPLINNVDPQNPVPSPPPQEVQKPTRRSWFWILFWILNPRHIPIFLGGVRDFILVAKPVEKIILNSKAMSDPDLVRFTAKAVACVVWGLLGTSVLGTLGIDTKPLVAGIGVSGFIVGFTLKEVATNILAGILLVLQRPFRAGWKIKVGNFQGTVLSIDSRYVRLETENKEMVLMPSYQVYSASITVINRGAEGRANGR